MTCISIGDQLQVRIKKGLLNLPSDNDTPIICVGPGTGIAPVRAVIEERTLQQAYSKHVQAINYGYIIDFPSQTTQSTKAVVLRPRTSITAMNSLRLRKLASSDIGSHVREMAHQV